MASRLKPLWSDDKNFNEVLDDIEEDKYSRDGLVDLVYNLFEDIICLKEDLKEK